MEINHLTLIGIDGGATKVSGWIVNYSAEDNTYSLSEHHAELPYSSIDGHLSNFRPVSIPDQLAQRDQEEISTTDDEATQGNCYIEATSMVIQSLASLASNNPVLIGIGMPGLKTADRRGINVIANGPRMIDYCKIMEKKLNSKDVSMIAPVNRIGSDADYCGIGELYAEEGSFRNVNNAYYLGGGTGAADAMILKGELVPFDTTKIWMAKTWEMKNDLDLSFERYASASGLQFIYSKFADKSVESLTRAQIFSPQIADKASSGETAAIKTFEEVAKYLAILVFERISTLFCGSENKLKFINPNHELLDDLHTYRGEKFNKIVIGQRLADLMSSTVGQKVVTKPFLSNLSDMIRISDCLTNQTKDFYLRDDKFKDEKLVFSKLREAPALGAGIDAHLLFTTK